MRRASGMALLELMGVLILLAALSLIAAQLFHSILRITDQAMDVPRHDRRRSELLDRMRSDAWGAMELRIAGDHELILRLAGRRSVFWKISPEGPSLRRTELLGTQEQSLQQWDGRSGSLPVSFRPSGPGVTVVWPRGRGDAHPEADLYSQLILLTGARP